MTVDAPAPPTRHQAGRGRGLVRTVGILMVAVGLGFLGYVAWQYWGTNVVSKHKQAEVKQVISDNWGKGIDGDAIGLLRVPRFGSDYEAPIVEGFDDKALAKGVGWYPDGAKPGEIGNFVVAGHRVTHGELFSKFPKLRKGDEVFVETRRKIYTYRLRNSGTSIIVDFSTGWPLQRVPDPALRGEPPTQAVMTMLTCSELFHTDNRSVVIADLESTKDKATGKISKPQ